MADVKWCSAFSILLFTLLLQGSREKSISKSKSSIKPAQNSLNDTCSLALDGGPCQGFKPRYYYNKGSGKCEEFIYGGCDGNGNNFKSKSDCESVCVRKKDKPKQTLQALGGMPAPTATTTQNKSAPCQKARTQASASQVNAFIPTCDAQGFYEPKQCWHFIGSCWCVDPFGSKVGEVNSTTNSCSKRISPKTSSKPAGSGHIITNSECLKKVHAVGLQLVSASLVMHGLNIIVNRPVFIPKCDPNTGLFMLQQCIANNCWCVSRHFGNEIKNTRHTKGANFKCPS